MQIAPNVEELTFSLGTVVQIVSLVIAAVSAWFYLRKNFEANSMRIKRVETDIHAHGEAMTVAVKDIGSKLDTISGNLHDTKTELVRIAGAGDVLATRVGALEARPH